MKNRELIIGVLAFVIVAISTASFTVLKEQLFSYPEYWPIPEYDFKKNPVGEDGFQLGRRLFYDPALSRDGSISCASCHLQATGFTHVDHDLSHGIDGRIGTRNSLALMNLAWNTSFNWDGGVNHIDMQALQPITSLNEMDSSLLEVVDKLNGSITYRDDFYQVFNDSIITGQYVLKALSQFTISLVSSNSKYDKYMENPMENPLTDQEIRGLDLFKNNCNSCHTAPLFNTTQFKNNGLDIDPTLNDFGRMRVTLKAEDSLKFKVPTLRNIEFTAPYMHDGRFESLREVLDHYSEINQNETTHSSEMSHLKKLTSNEKTDLILFLKTLSDYEFLYDPRFSFPKNNTTP